MLTLVYNAQTKGTSYVEVPDEEIAVLPPMEIQKTDSERISDLELLVLQLGGII